MKKSRRIFLHPECNKVKIKALDTLQYVYTQYTNTCIEEILANRLFDVKFGNRKHVFTKEASLTCNIRSCSQTHSIAKVSSWIATSYTNKVKPHITKLYKAGWITDEFAKSLYVIGKKYICRPWEFITQDHLDFYWNLLLNSDIAGKQPRVSTCDGMYMTEHTGVITECENTEITNIWLKFSHLGPSSIRIQLPLLHNPQIKSIKDMSKGIRARKDKQNRWYFELLEKVEHKLTGIAKDAPSVGIDVGQNVLVTTSNGDLFGVHVKPRYSKHKNIIKDIRANRQRQGLDEDSARVIKLDARLTAYLITEARTATNKLVKKYPGHRFVVEDLDLKGVRGDRRFGDTRFVNALKIKAHTITINPAYTSQECPSCGYVSRKNRYGTKFQCRSCGRISHADVVGAINVLRRSKDKSIDCDDNPKAVKAVLRERYLRKRNSSVIVCLDEPQLYGLKLTVDSGNMTCIASHLVANPLV